MGRAGAFLTALHMIPLDAHLLAAILAEPDNDALRLVCADWWWEQGEVERAEFVRIQVEMAMREGYAGANRSRWSNELKRRMEKLCCRERELMWQPFESPPIYRWTERLRDVGLVTWTFRRGFVHALTCAAADWLAHADAIRTREPVQAVTLATWPEIAVWYEEDESPGSRKAMLRQLERQWHGITFTLPPDAAPVTWS